MATGERRARSSRTKTKPALTEVAKFVLPTEVKAGTRSHLKNDELRAGLLNWPAERIADYLISFVGWDFDRRSLELCVIAQVDVAHSVAGLRRQMEIAVDVSHVKWDEVREFVLRLERVLAAIRSIGHDHPPEAADLGWEFLSLIRSAADAVQGEDELPNFFDEALAAAHELAVKAGVAADERARKLIDAYVTGSGYAMGEPAVELVRGLDLNSAQRIDVAAHARNHMNMKGASGSCCKELGELAQFLAN